MLWTAGKYALMWQAEKSLPSTGRTIGHVRALRARLSPIEARGTLAGTSEMRAERRPLTARPGPAMRP
jgi:hypothetical protein